MAGDFVSVLYELKAKNLRKAAEALALGQSLGNPWLRTKRDHGLRSFRAEVVDVGGSGVWIAYPRKLFPETANVSHLLSVLMGGQMDLGLLTHCRLVDVALGPLNYPGPRFGVQGIRHLVRATNGRPLIGAILKPKVGLKPSEMAEICAEMALGGADFIKEDEILGDVPYAPLEERVEAIQKAIRKTKRHTLYAPCITSDNPLAAASRAGMATARAVHLNVWNGFGSYLHLRTCKNMALFFQRSGMQVWTNGPFSISDRFLYKLVNAIGCDIAHVGMYGGYLSDSKQHIHERMQAMGDTLPSFSCGMNPTTARQVVKAFGPDVLLTSGGWIHNHPRGPRYALGEIKKAVT